MFPQDFSCLVVLWIPASSLYLRLRVYYPLWLRLSIRFLLDNLKILPVHTPNCIAAVKFGLFRVRSPLLTESLLFSFPEGTQMFQFPSSHLNTLCIHVLIPSFLPMVGFPIRKSAVYRLFAPTRSLSQLVASFIVSQCQGIRPVLLVA